MHAVRFAEQAQVASGRLGILLHSESAGRQAGNYLAQREGKACAEWPAQPGSSAGLARTAKRAPAAVPPRKLPSWKYMTLGALLRPPPCVLPLAPMAAPPPPIKAMGSVLRLVSWVWTLASDPYPAKLSVREGGGPKCLRWLYPPVLLALRRSDRGELSLSVGGHQRLRSVSATQKGRWMAR